MLAGDARIIGWLIPLSEMLFARRLPQPAFCHLNLTYCGDTKSSMRRDGSFLRTSILMGKFAMKMFGSSLFGQAVRAAGVGTALMLSVSAGHAQASGTFSGFDGSWSGTGTVSLANR